MKHLLSLLFLLSYLNLASQNHTITHKRGANIVAYYGDTRATSVVNGDALAEALLAAQDADSLLLSGVQNEFDGCFVGNFTISKAIVLKGSSDGTTVAKATTIISATNRVFYINAANTTLLNLTISSGNLYKGNGGGVYLNVGGVTMRSCSFVDNQIASDGSAATWGGAIYVPAGKTPRTIVEDCQFLNNASNGNLNSATQTGNERGIGGAVGCNGKASPMSFINCVFANNFAKTYGAAYASNNGNNIEDNLQFINCSVVNNKIGSNTLASGIHSASGGGSTFINTVICGNTGGEAQWVRASNQSNNLNKYINCAFEGPSYASIGALINCFYITDHSEFFVKPTLQSGLNPIGGVDYQDANWSLKPAATLINRGQDVSDMISYDLIGNPRKQVGYVDIGAYESGLKGNMEIAVAPEDVTIFVGQQLPDFHLEAKPDALFLGKGVFSGLPLDSRTSGKYIISATLSPEDSPYWNVSAVSAATLEIVPPSPITGVEDETPILIVLGQSNADGTAFANPAEDAVISAWYNDKVLNPGLMKIWYRSCYIVNQTNGSRWVFDGSSIDALPGWMDLYYKNDNLNGRTNMVMRHGDGTWSASATGRRGMEGQFGKQFQTRYPDKELFVFKLGCSGSSIDTWNVNEERNNWDYFYHKIFKPAIEDLLHKGKKPRLVGVWWMQGEADRSDTKQEYEAKLNQVIAQCRDSLGFKDGHIYVGQIVKPGESTSHMAASKQFGQGVRDAQLAVAAQDAAVSFVSTSDCPFDSDDLHFSHVGISRIGDRLAQAVISKDVNGWATFQTPGKWSNLNQSANSVSPVSFTPDLDGASTLSIRYFVDGQWTLDVPTKVGSFPVRAELDFLSWTDIIMATLTVNTSTDISQPKVAERWSIDDVAIAVKQSKLSIINKTDESLNCTVYNVTGETLASIQVSSGQTILPLQLPSGIYLVSACGATNRRVIKTIIP